MEVVAAAKNSHQWHKLRANQRHKGNVAFGLACSFKYVFGVYIVRLDHLPDASCDDEPEEDADEDDAEGIDFLNVGRVAR